MGISFNFDVVFSANVDLALKDSSFCVSRTTRKMHSMSYVSELMRIMICDWGHKQNVQVFCYNNSFGNLELLDEKNNK